MATQTAAVEPVEEPRWWLLWLVALLPVLGAYSNVASVGFMWDDHMLIEQNTDLHTLQAPWAYLTRTFWQHPFLYGAGHAFYRPLVTFTLAVDWALGGGGPTLFHLTNLALHLAVCSLVFAFARARSGSGLTAAAVTMLFGVMPRLTESVSWIVGRTDVLATLFVLLALLVVERADQRWRWSAAPLLFLGLLAKEVALVGLVTLALERWLRPRARLREDAALLGALAVAVVAWWLLRSAQPSAAPLRLHDAATFFAGLGHYALMVLTPWNPAAQIGFILEPEGWATALGVVASLGGAVAAVAWWRSSSAWRAAWLTSAVAALVLVSLVVLTVYTIASDRFLYLPLALGAVVAAQRAWPRAALISALLVTVALAPLTWRRNELWADPLRFWEEVYRTASPKNPGAAAGLGDALFELSRFEEARCLFLRAEEVRGRRADSPSRLSLAVTESRLGHDAAALELLTLIISENPGWRRAAYDEVLFRARALDFEGATAALSRVRARFGDDEVLRDFEALIGRTRTQALAAEAAPRARALHELGATRKAQAAWEVALADPPTRAEAAHWLVLFGDEAAARNALALLGDDSGAQAVFSERFPRAGAYPQCGMTALGDPR